MKISLIIAAYNEVETLPKLIQLAQPFVDEIIVVDDGSSDNTETALSQLPIKYIKNPQNLGQERSVETGLRESQGDIIVTIDADLEHEPSDIPKLIQALLEQKIDMIIGSREIIPRHSEQNVAHFTLSKYNIADPFCGFRIMHRHVFDQIGFFHKHDNYGIDFVLQAAQKFKVGNATITHMPRRQNPRIGSSDQVDKKINMVLEYLKAEY